MSTYKDIPVKATLYKSGITLFINDVKINSWLEPLKITQIVTRRSSDFQATILETGSTYDNINFLDEVRIYYQTTQIFLGRIENRSKVRDVITVSGRNYWAVLLERYINEAYTAQTASYIIEDILDSKFTEFGKQITTTTATYTKEYRNVPAHTIIAEFCELEGFQAYIKMNKDFVFEPEGFEASGKSFNVDTGLGGVSNHDFINIGKKVKNIVTMYCKPGETDELGITASRRNHESIDLYGEKETVLTNPSIDNIKDCEKAAEAALNRFTDELKTGNLMVFGDETLFAGQTVLFTCAELGYTDETFLVISLEHSFPGFQTKLTIADVSLDVSDLLYSLLRRMERSDAMQSDSSTAITRFELYYENFKVAAEYEIYKQFTAGPEYNAAEYNVDDYGPIGSGLNLIDSGDILITNTGLNAIRDMLYGDTINEPDHIGIGIGTTPPSASDTALENETQTLPRNSMDTGYPNKPQDYKVEYQIDVGTGEFNGEDLSELGLFNAVSSGVMFCRQTFTPISKTISFSLKFRVILTVSAG